MKGLLKVTGLIALGLVATGCATNAQKTTRDIKYVLFICIKLVRIITTA